MPVLETVAPARQQNDRPKGTNKIKLPNGTRAAAIVDVYIFNVTADKERAYASDLTGERNVRVKVQFDKRPDIVLAKTFRLYLGKKAAFAQFLQTVTGIEAGSDAMRKFDTDELLSDRYKFVFVTTEYSEPYTNILTITPRPREDDDFGAAPAHTQPSQPEPAPIHPGRIRTRLLELLRTNVITPGEKALAINSVTGSDEPSSIATPELAARVVARLEEILKAATEEFPW